MLKKMVSTEAKLNGDWIVSTKCHFHWITDTVSMVREHSISIPVFHRLFFFFQIWQAKEGGRGILQIKGKINDLFYRPDTFITQIEVYHFLLCAPFLCFKKGYDHVLFQNVSLKILV